MKKGYTLLELLVSITILGFLIAMVAISAIYFYNERREKEYNNLVQLIKDNAKVLVTSDDEVIDDVNTLLTTTGDVCKITYADLVSKKLMNESTINPKTKQVVDSSIFVKVELTEDYGYEYTFVDPTETSTGTIQNCIN